MSLDRYANAVSDAQRKDEDIDNAIKESLDLHSGRRALPQSTLIPQAESDWTPYLRPDELTTIAERDASSLKDVARGSNNNQRELCKAARAKLYHWQNRQSPHSEGGWTSYGRPPKFPDEGRADTPVKQEAGREFFNESQNTYQELRKDRTDFLAEQESIKEAKKEQVQAENVKDIQAGQTASELHTEQRGAEVSQTTSSSTQRSPKTETTTVPPAVPLRPTIEDRIKEIQCERTTLLSWTDDPNGDTYVFIDPPAQQPEQTHNMYNDYISRYQRPLVIRSAALVELNSQFFDRLLKPTAQYRTVRRRGLVGRLPDHIKYVIDLTPPSEGEDAAWLMTELCCAEGVRNWHQAWARWDISRTLVGGKDEFLKQAEDEAQDEPPPELSPIRHRNSIERVLNAIRNTDPRLDSAVKVYTTFVVARFFDIVHSPLTDYIVRWLRAPPNSLFIEALPEIALKIGDGFQCYDLIRDSFAILVGEEALASLVGISNPTHTVNGRKKNDVPESYQTRIEYASKSFVDRTTQIFSGLVEPDMGWLETLQQFQVLSDKENESLVLLLQETKEAFKAFVRGAIYSVLWSDLDRTPAVELGWGSGDSLYPRTSQTAFWNSLDVMGRIMTRTFWSALEEFCRCGGFVGPTNLKSWAEPDISLDWSARTDGKKTFEMCRKYGIAEIRYGYLENLTVRCRNSQPGKSTGLLKPLLIQPFGTSHTYGQQESKPYLPWSDHLSSPVRRQETNDNKTGNSDGDSDAVSLSRYGLDLDLGKLCREVENYILRLCSAMLCPPDASNREEAMKQVMTPTLVCLDEAEWKYLPLYAGGLDDGSGGVFNDDVPMAETGFSTAGPGVHTGTGSSTASSDFEYVGDRDLESTHHTSTMTNDSSSDQLDHRIVYDGGDDDDSLWKHIRNNKAFDGSTTMSHVDTATMAAPSTVEDAESEHGFILPLRSKDPEPATHSTAAKVPMKKPEESEGSIKEANLDQEDYSDIFMGSDDEGDVDDEDDDTATERGEDDNLVEADKVSDVVDSEDEEMVLV
ncbi:MAG: hypothetical protein Q9182_000095 [Xanthomendoza sp. 2 TL-2023]